MEKYEKGEKEFPKKSLEKLKNFFFISERFLEEGDSQIFKTFILDSDEVEKLLKDGFRPYFLCCSHERSELMTYPVFYKQENGYSRVVKANSLGSFCSIGGGYNNIVKVIIRMLNQEMNYNDAFIVKVDQDTWHKLNKNTFYATNMYFGFGKDYECADIFYEYYQKEKNHFNRD